MRSTIICVDDEKTLLNMLSEQLLRWFGANYRIRKATSGEEVLQIMDECTDESEEISVVVTDYVMPVMKGDELLREVNKRNPRIRNIMLTSYSSADGILSAINGGGLYRYIAKPWDAKDLMLTVLEAIRSYESESKIVDTTERYESLLAEYEELMTDSEKRNTGSIQSIINAIEFRMPEKVGHAKAVAQYAKLLGKSKKMSHEELRILEKTALLHNIGLIALPDEEVEKWKNTILMSDRETIEKKQGATEFILASMEDSERMISILRYQHDRYDGVGAPPVGAGFKTPLESRIIAVSSFFTMKKIELVKHQKFTIENFISELSLVKGTYLSPSLIDILVSTLKGI